MSIVVPCHCGGTLRDVPIVEPVPPGTIAVIECADCLCMLYITLDGSSLLRRQN